jgi:hypothetical protein
LAYILHFGLRLKTGRKPHVLTKIASMGCIVRNIKKGWLLSAATATLFVVAPFAAAQAAVINFDTLPAFNNYDHLTGSFGSTADVTVSYQTLNADFTYFSDYVETWNAGYANLNTAAYAGYSGGILDITLTAVDSSKSVILDSFDVAAYPTGLTGRLASVLQLRDGAGNVLLNYAPFTASGITAQTLTPGVTAHSISILLGTDWDNGVNNINFSLGDTAPSAVPEPATMLLLGTGLAGLAAARRKKKA